MNSYVQTLERLFSLPLSHKVARDLVLPQAVDQLLDFPARAFPTIHVAGSNGKGSVATKVAKALELSGYRVGLYTSPHLHSFCERIAINSVCISEEGVVLGAERLLSLGLEMSFFELTTFLALLYFREQKVDVAVIETGIGGRFDCTNVITPLLSIITSISKEHVALLGEDLEQIAFQKAGIIKPSVPVVLGPKARYRAIYDEARQCKSPLCTASNISYFFDEENSETARLSLEQLKPHFSLTPQAIAQGIVVRPSCRFERIGHVIFDVAHNPEAVFALLQALHTFFPQRTVRFCVGFCKDKDYVACLELIADVATHIHLVKADSPRAATAEELQLALYSEDPQFSTLHPSVESGVQEAFALSKQLGELLVVCGSFYIMDLAKQGIREHVVVE